MVYYYHINNANEDRHMATFTTCTKCAGSGKVTAMHVMNGVCFKCKGTGKQAKMRRIKVEYPAYRAVSVNGDFEPEKVFSKDKERVLDQIEFYNECARWPAELETRQCYRYEYVPA